MILVIRTDKPEAELYILNRESEIEGEVIWEAHRELSNTIFYKINEVFKQCNASYGQLKGVIVYEGPGSFTGLRIGATVANTLASSLDIPIVGTTGHNWISQGAQRLLKEENDQIITPKYGGEPNITKPRK